MQNFQEYLHDHEQSLKEYKKCLKEALECAKKNLINAINKIQSLNQEHKQKIISYFNSDHYNYESDDTDFDNENNEAKKVIKKYKIMIMSLKQSNIHFEKEIDSAKQKTEKKIK